MNCATAMDKALWYVGARGKDPDPVFKELTILQPVISGSLSVKDEV